MSAMTPVRRSANLALAALALVTFVIGTAELMIVGILGRIAGDTGVSVGTAGRLVTGYALGIAVGAPILSALVARFDARWMLRAALVAFLLGNVVAALTASFALLVVFRVITGALHGLVAGIATALAASLVAAERRGRAISIVVGGITVSTVVGVPVGTLIAQALGWRAAFAAVIVLGAIAFAVMVAFVPRPSVDTSASAPAAGGTRAAFAPRVLALLVVGVLLYAGQFTAFTYLVPFLADRTGISGGLISIFLLAYGAAATVGTLLGGRAADWNATSTMIVANLVLVVALAGVYFGGTSPASVMVALAIWGVAGFAIPPALLLRATTLAGSGGDQAATLGISAANAGIAAGSLIGGIVIAAHGANATMLVALILCAVAVPATWATRWIRATTAGQDLTVPTATHSCARACPVSANSISTDPAAVV